MSHRTVLMIDAHTLRKHTQAASQGGMLPSIDYGELRKVFTQLSDGGRLIAEEDRQLLRAMYYSLIINDGEGDQGAPIIRLLDWLSYNGFTVKTTTVRRAADAAGWASVMMAVDALALSARIDTLHLIASTDDLVPAVDAVQRAGVRVVLACAPQICGDALRRQVDEVVDLLQIMQLCTVPHKARA